MVIQNDRDPWSQTRGIVRMKQNGTKLTAALLAAVVFLTFAGAARAVTDEEVGKAIDRLKKILFRLQKPNGAFEDAAQGGHVGGYSALATLALLESGESPQRAELTKAIAWLESVKLGTPPPAVTEASGTGKIAQAQFKTDNAPTTNNTYAISLMTHVWAALPPEFLGNLDRTGTFLLTQSHNGGGSFHYAPTKNPHDYDNSTTQYGVLGVWEAAKAGARVPPSFWEKVAQHFIECQNDDGGWQYGGGGKGPGKNSTLPMSVAGLTSMFIVQQQLFSTASKPNPKIEETLNRGLEWLDTHFAADGNLYYMYGVERVGLASGYKFFNGRDWYQAGAQVLVNYSGGDVVNTSFALLFLARGRVPVWISKLKVPDQPWNNRPNDLYYLTRFISDQREAEQNWQVVSIDVAPELWVGVPVVYLASDKAVKLTEGQKKNLKRYLDLGGTLLTSPDNGSAEFRKWALALAKELYPQYPPRRMTSAHPMLKALYQIDSPGEEIETISNGARELIIMPSRDWGMEFQTRGSELDGGKGAASSQIMRLAMNLWTVVTERGTLGNRLEQGVEFKARGAAGATGVRVGRAKYDGNWLPEPAAWDVISVWTSSHGGVQAMTEDIDLDKIGDSDLPLIHLQGTEPAKLTDAQIEAIKKYTDKGGTLLVETVGGQKNFAGDFEVQWAKAIQQPPVPMIGGNDPVITGEKLTGGFDARRSVYRRDGVLRGLGTSPRLRAFRTNNRTSVIVSGEDLTLGGMNVRQVGIIGYNTDSSRQILANILLSVRK